MEPPSGKHSRPIEMYVHAMLGEEKTSILTMDRRKRLVAGLELALGDVPGGAVFAARSDEPVLVGMNADASLLLIVKIVPEENADQVVTVTTGDLSDATLTHGRRWVDEDESELTEVVLEHLRLPTGRLRFDILPRSDDQMLLVATLTALITPRRQSSFAPDA